MGTRAKYLWLLLLMNAGWGASLAVVQALGRWLETGQIVTLRFAVAWAMLQILWPWLPGPALRRWEWVRAMVMGLLVFVLGQRLQVWGNLLDTAANSSVLMGIEPLLTAVAAALFLRERIDPRRWAGFALGITGVLLLNRIWQPQFQWASLAANLIFISSFVCEASYSILGKPMVENQASPWKVLTIGLGTATVINCILEGPSLAAAAVRLPPEGWLWLGYMAVICTVVGYSVWLMALRIIPVNLAAMTIFLQPLAGIPVAALWLNEPLHWGQLWGGWAIAAGLWIALTESDQPQQART